MGKPMSEEQFSLVSEVECACGCGSFLKEKDRFYRPKRYVSGHNGRKYTSPESMANPANAAKKRYNVTNRDKYNKWAHDRCRKLKGEFILRSSGKCLSCGLAYDGTNARLFDFHHRDPSSKLFNLSLGSFKNVNLLDLEIERLKCDLLCANCHRDITGGEY